MSDFTKLLKKTREDKNMSKIEVAKLFGWSPMYYGRFENGYLNPSNNNIKKFSEFIGLSVDELNNILKLNNKNGEYTDE